MQAQDQRRITFDTVLNGGTISLDESLGQLEIEDSTPKILEIESRFAETFWPKKFSGILYEPMADLVLL